ncbi:MAG: heme ABC exporter ATP-binding protein CcmA [Thermoplasmatota archaeon]
MQDAPAVAVTGLAKRYGNATALADVTLALAAGDTAWLAGANGAGKSTLLRIVASLERPTRGEVRLEGVSAAEDGAKYRARLAFVGHAPALYDELTARENCLFVARFHRRESAVDAALAAFGATALAAKRARALSRGERQRVALARAFAIVAPRLLLDEPTTALDADGVARLALALKERARRADAVTLVASHDAVALTGLATRRLSLDRGRIAEDAR